MLRGTTLFKCHECGNTFRDFDIEWNATVFSTPQPCPQCNSLHTYPRWNFLSGPRSYRPIWEHMDKIREEMENGQNETDVTDVNRSCENDSANDSCMEKKGPGFTETVTTVLLATALTGLAIFGIKNR